jgi:hypothetical protein
MQTNNLNIYDSWDRESDPTLISTYFYNLAPEGVGTPLAEQLSCYWIRLAQAHNVQCSPSQTYAPRITSIHQ